MPTEASIASLLEQVASAKPFAKALRARKPAQFPNVARAAQAIVTAASIQQRAKPGARTWILCADVRAQEQLASELPTWGVPTTEIPELVIVSDIDALQDPEVSARRLGIIRNLADPASELDTTLVLLDRSLDEDTPAPSTFEKSSILLSPATEMAMEKLADDLTEAGYEKTFQVANRGEFAIRGGIFDVFSWQSDLPIRAEFFGDEIESLREFEPDTQTTVGRLKSAEILLRTGDHADFCTLRDYIGKKDLLISIDCPTDFPVSVEISAGVIEDTDFEAPTACYDEPLGVFDAGDFILQAQRRENFITQLDTWESEDFTTVMFFNNEGEIERFRELIDPSGEISSMGILTGGINRGFTIPGAKIAVLADAEIFGRYQSTRSRHLFGRESKQRAARNRDKLTDLKEGDLVVHSEYGIGKLIGLKPANEDDAHGAEEVIVIEYANESKLYVPVHHSHLISRYIGSGSTAPQLSELGGGRWAKKKAATEKSVLDYASQLLSTQATRDAQKGYQHPPDGRWQMDFENSFLYRETPDQLRSIAEVKTDMESVLPMDRLLCGDVGFGKTEVAIRAAFKSVMGGRQVAILVPTTVLAQQHYQNFRERMSEYPVTVGTLSRFRTRKEQKATVKGIADGSVDIVIGTHRLISKDIHFKNLGLVVIDEEQRFGVSHKERFKEMFVDIDVLTLSATPIPRTLYLSLMGVRDMSTIDTPPAARRPVQTQIAPYDDKTICQAIERELRRDGQVYFLHNRVATIDKFAKQLSDFFPDARVVVGHGQMEEGQMEAAMQKFISAEADILVCTTIIESGIDIPNANTIIIDRADRFGLADLYQLRGRVGRAQDKAYALLLLPPEQLATGDARRRVNAIRQYSALGSGFHIAMRDLEIRGAGNLLGSQQSGHIAAVGFDLYCQLLKGAVSKLQGKPVPGRVDVGINLDFICMSEAEYLSAPDPTAVLPAFIPSTFISESRARIIAYRRFAELSNKKEITALKAEWKDRFGKLPEPVEILFTCSSIKIAASAVNIQTVEVRDRKVMLTRNGDYLLPGKRFPRLTAKTPNHSLEEVLRLIQTA